MFASESMEIARVNDDGKDRNIPQISAFYQSLLFLANSLVFEDRIKPIYMNSKPGLRYFSLHLQWTSVFSDSK